MWQWRIPGRKIRGWPGTRAICPDAKPQRGEGKGLGSVWTESWGKLVSSQGQVWDNGALSKELEKREGEQARRRWWDSEELVGSSI